MAISRAQLLKELLPGLNALFGMEYARYGEEHKEIYETEKSERSFEEETKLAGFGAAPVKNEGSAIAYDNAQEAFTARYNHETIALGFSITEEAIEDNVRYVRGVLNEVRPRFGLKVPVVALGFSQGASMAWRAALLAGHEIEAAIAFMPWVNGGVLGGPNMTPWRGCTAMLPAPAAAAWPRMPRRSSVLPSSTVTLSSASTAWTSRAWASVSGLATSRTCSTTSASCSC